MRFWVFCYDISDHRTRLAVARTLADAGACRVQYSVFEGWFDSRAITRLYAELRPLITGKSDRLRAFPLPTHARGRRIAQGTLPAASALSSHWVV